MLGFEIKYGHMVHLGIEVLPGLGCFKQQHVLTDMLNKKITEEKKSRFLACMVIGSKI